MKKFCILFTVVLSGLISACSIGKDKKEFTCEKWDVSYKNSSVADRLNSIASLALGSKAAFEFYDNQIKMTFQGDQIVFTKNNNGVYIYEKPYYVNGKSGIIEYQLYPREEVGYNFVTSCILYFYIDNINCGQASFSRDF